jgi:glycosyltransferase involved in cell wall biosynthesis
MAKVCHLITRLILGGAQRLALETAVSLKRAGSEVELWSGPQTGPEGTLHDEARGHGLALRIIPDLVREVAPFKDLRALHALARLLRRERFEILHTHSSKAGIIGRRAGVAAGVPVRIHTIHGWPMTPATRAPARWLYTRLEREAARSAHCLVAVSEAVRDAGLAARIGCREQYQVIRGGVTMPPAPTEEDRARARQKLGLPSDALVLGTVGRLDDAKDPLSALHAGLPLLRGSPAASLVFIGDGRLRPAMERARAASGCAAQIVLAGLRPNASELLPAFDIFFLSSRWEGFPLVVIEAMAASLPVVAYDVAGVREAVIEAETGYLSPPGRTECWRAALQSLINDPQRRRHMGLSGRARAATSFDLPRMLRSTHDLYRRLLDRDRPAVL